MSKNAVSPERILKDLGLFSAPVNVEGVAAGLGLSVTLDKLDDDVSGVLLVRGGHGSILINKDQHANRRRFTVAHEIGHFVLHWRGGEQSDRLFLDRRYPTFSKVDDNVYLRSSSRSTSPQEEVEANDFAAALLMPKELVVAVVHDLRLALNDEEDVARCARTFGVSEQAMLIRLKRLRLLRLS